MSHTQIDTKIAGRGNVDKKGPKVPVPGKPSPTSSTTKLVFKTRVLYSLNDIRINTLQDV